MSRTHALRGRAAGARALAALLACAAWSVQAVPAAPPGGVSVAPLRLDLSRAQRSGAMTLTNAGDRSYRFQVEPMRWSQDAQGNDVYEPAPELLANPPLFELPAGGSRVIRVGLAKVPALQREAAYRLYLTEIPQPQAVSGTALQVLLRMGVPLFVAPGRPAPGLVWSAQQRDRTLVLRADNRGNVHARRAQLRISEPGSGRALHEQGGFQDILAGGHATWTLPLSGPAPAQIQIDADTQDRHERVVIGVDRP